MQHTNRDAVKKGKVTSMSELTQAQILRNLAETKRNKSQNRVSSTTVLAEVTDFLNDDNDEFRAVENMFPNGTKHSSIVARFRNVIVENKVDELVYPVIADDHVYLVKLAQ